MSGESFISMVCACGKKLTAPAASVGKRARCPACGNIVVLKAKQSSPPQMVGATVSAPVSPSPRKTSSIRPSVRHNDDGLSGLYDLAEQAESAAPLKEAAQCPQCRSIWDDGAVLCTQCGYDTRTGKKRSTATVTAAKATVAAVNKTRKQPVDLMAPQGSFMAGLVMSAAFALAASIVWIVIAWFTGFAIGAVAVLIGGAAGVGMQLGQKGHSSNGGRAAAGLTVLAILFAKVVVIELLLNRQGFNRSIFDLNQAKLGFYLFSPMSLVFMAIGMGAAYRAGNGSVSG